MKAHGIFVSLLALLVGSSAAIAKNPFVVIHSSKSITTEDAVLFSEGNISVIKTPDASEKDFEDLYVVKLPFHVTFSDLSQYGQVLHYDTNNFAVIKSDRNKTGELSSTLHRSGMACGALLLLDGTPVAPNPPAIPIPRIEVGTTEPAVERAIEKIDGNNIKETVGKLSAIKTRYHETESGKGVAAFLKTLYSQYISERTDVEFEIFQHGTRTPQPSLVVRIKGSTKPEEIIILGSHIDSVNWDDGVENRAPGADDNASGTATNLEIFRVLMSEGIRPERTIEIHGYAAEEVGLVGSGDMAKKYAAQNKKVVAMVQHDMNMYRPKTASTKIWFIENNTVAELNTMLGKLVDRYVKVPWEVRQLWGGDSDHTSWRRSGFAAAFPFEDPRSYNGMIHTSDDTLDVSPYSDQAAAFAKLGVAYAVHFGGIVK